MDFPTTKSAFAFIAELSTGASLLMMSCSPVSVRSYHPEALIATLGTFLKHMDLNLLHLRHRARVVAPLL